MITVKCTREGLLGGKTASGYRVETDVPFVALPSTAALRLWVKVTNPANGKSIHALCLDVGPWNEKDHAYVFGEGKVRPQAETGIDSFGRLTNKAGIDLGEKVWHALGYKTNGPCAWEFL
jgi:hypothetical protein